MKRNRKGDRAVTGVRGRAETKAPAKTPPVWKVSLVSVVGGAGIVVSMLFYSRPGKSDTPAYVPHPTHTLTFNRDIAPVILDRCAYCHRPGQAAPFTLLTYADVRKHAKQIAEVTARRYMPPWLLAPGYGDFADGRSLTEEQLGVLQQWLGEGAVEGSAADLPPPPKWAGEWTLGQPDLIIKLPQPYVLPAEGKDVYRNLVIPLGQDAPHFIKGAEFLPGNPKVVHHAFIYVDETRQSRRLAEKENPPGFDGMDVPDTAVMPGGQLLGWQPGKRFQFASDGLSWVLKTNMDLVVQMHLHPSGKPELVQPTVGFYFTDQVPTNVPFRIKLARFDFEIPAGDSNYVVEQSYVLPTDLQLLRVLPHAHYLGKDLQGYALLPGGQKQWLFWIKDWDFNWQGDYKYAQPVCLPKGSRLVMHYTYDNSTNNLRNPNRPLKTVRNGPQTTDEMAGLVLQALARNAQERAVLAKDYFAYFGNVSLDYFRFLVRLDPNDPEAQTKLGRALSAQGQTDEGMTHLLAAVKLKPDYDKAHYELGYLYLLRNQLGDAYQEFQKVIQLNPEDHQAFGNLGLICLRGGRLSEAKSCFEAALRLDPDDLVAKQYLSRLQEAR
jgi:hypothetical protein